MKKRILSLAVANSGVSEESETNTRRRRFRARAPDVQIEAMDDEGNAVEFDCFDLSAVGVYLYSDLLLFEGEKLDLRLTLPSSPRPVTVEGEVVRAETGEGVHEPGMGVAFRNIGRDVQAELRRYVARRFFRHARAR